MGSSEDALYDQQIRDVESWWASDRYKGIKRPYTAHDIVSKRGSFQTQYPSSLMARKLFNLLEEKAAKGEPLHTSKSPDPGAKLNTCVYVVVATLFSLMRCVEWEQSYIFHAMTTLCSCQADVDQSGCH